MANDRCIAAFVMTNLSESPVWFEDLAVDFPNYSFEWKDHYYGLPQKAENGSCAGGGRVRKLAAGETCHFNITFHKRVEGLKSFRVGVWVWTSLSETIPQDVFWSDYVSL
jgi:hypothetical protein